MTWEDRTRIENERLKQRLSRPQAVERAEPLVDVDEISDLLRRLDLRYPLGLLVLLAAVAWFLSR